MAIQFWFEFASTYSYPAAMRVRTLAERRGITVLWRVFLLGPIFRAQGWNDSPFNIYHAKGLYMWRDLERICENSALPFQRPSSFPRNGLLASRIACRFSDADWLPDFVKAVYRANFADDLDIASESTIAHCLASVGQNPSEVLAESQLQASKDKLRTQCEQAVRLGIFGAPSFIVGDELFWGNDRLEDALLWHAKHFGGTTLEGR